MRWSLTPQNSSKLSSIIPWFSRMLVSTSGVANFRSTGLESSQFCCPIADELTFAGFSVYFVRFCLNFSYFSLVLSLFGISVSTNRCELPLLNATICHLPQTWKNICILKIVSESANFSRFINGGAACNFEKHFLLHTMIFLLSFKKFLNFFSCEILI